MSGLIGPYGGKLVDLVLAGDRLAAARDEAEHARKLTLSSRGLCDLELLATGGLSPLTGFMCRDDYERVVKEMRLATGPNAGTLWPLPVSLEAPEGFPDASASDVGPAPGAGEAAAGDTVALSDTMGTILALLDIEDVFDADLEVEKEHIWGNNEEHPSLARLRAAAPRYLGGKLRVLRLPVHHDFVSLRRTPAEVREMLGELGWSDVVAFQTRNPLHRAHEELIKRAGADVDGVLVHPVVGPTKPGDVDHFTRVRCYQAAMKHFDAERTALSLLPLAMRMAGPREAILHAIIRRNHGANRLIVGRDHAGPGSDSKGSAFYGPYDAQEALEKHQDEIGVAMVPFKMCAYVPDLGEYFPVDEVPEGKETVSISGTQVREEYLAAGRALPEWFTAPEVAALLAETYPPPRRQGLTVWFTGLSAAGKSTLAEILAQRLLEHGRPSTVLDGDIVRTHLSKGLGFSKEDRDTNIRRIGFVASEITRHGGTVLCAAISPYRAIREENRELIGNYVEVHVNAALEVCEARDKKGNYRKAREGIIKGFTGIDDPYEPPAGTAGVDYVECKTDSETPEASVARVLARLEELGYI
jgi:sulfate adenylyltransferase